MSIVYKFDIQHSFSVVIEDDSNLPLSIEDGRRIVIENLREYIDSSDLSDCCVSDGVRL